MKFLELAEQAKLDMTGVHPFIFTKKMVDYSEREIQPVDTDSILAPPYPKFTFEVEAGNLTVDREDEKGFYAYYTACVHVEEINAGAYNFTMLMHRRYKHDQTGPYTPQVLVIRHDDPANGDLYGSMLGLMNQFVERLYDESSYKIMAKVGQRKYRLKDKRKYTYRPKGVTYITPHRPGLGKTIQTAERLPANEIKGGFTRAHWRKLVNSESLGLNRLGERVVKGRTFIKSYKRGDLATPKVYQVSR